MSRNDLLDQARRVVAEARKRGAQDVRASASQVRSTSLEWRDGKVERVRESTQRSVSVDLFVDGRYSSSSTSDLRPAALATFLDECVALTRALAPDPARGLPDPARYAGRFEGDLAVCDRSGMSADERRTLVRALEAAAREAPGSDRILSVSADVGDDEVQVALATSNGLEATRESTAYDLGCQVSVRGEGDRKPSAGYGATTCRRAALPAAAGIGAEATRRAVREIGARPEKTGVYPCVVENRVVGSLLSGLMSPLSGAAIQQRQSFLAGKIGERIGSAALTLLDDPLLPEGLGSRPFDGEGMTRTRMPIFEAGVLRAFFLDTYYARKLDVPPTTGRTTNLVWGPGERDLDGLLRSMGTGLLITGFNGGNSSGTTGDFSIGVRGFRVENGALVRPVVEMNLSGCHRDFWLRLAEVGNDPWKWSPHRSPSLRFEGVQFSGT